MSEYGVWILRSLRGNLTTHHQARMNEEIFIDN